MFECVIPYCKRERTKERVDFNNARRIDCSGLLSVFQWIDTSDCLTCKEGNKILLCEMAANVIKLIYNVDCKWPYYVLSIKVIIHT